MAAWVLAGLAVQCMAARFVVLFAAVMSAPPPTPAPSASPSAHPDRRAPAEQPAPVERPTASAGSRWAVQADVERRGTGKANGTWIVERSPKMYAPTEEAAVLKQQEWINDYLHPKVSRSRLEPSEVRSWPSLGHSWPDFGVLPELLGARTERYEKTRVRSLTLS